MSDGVQSDAVEFDPFSADYFDNPYATYKRLRDERPVYTTSTTASTPSPAGTTSWTPPATGARTAAPTGSTSPP
jgi:hypothetical protein